jgi:tetratricopeptide (TPR) repeat protein
VPGVLRLETRDYDDGPARWHWVLIDASGAFVADHKVRIDEHSWQYEAFTDLRYYISWHAAPDRYAQDEARIVAEVGQWIGSEVFGPVADALANAARKTPVTVRVVVPEGAKTLLFRPLELAHVRGRPLTTQGVTLVMQTADDDSASDPVPVGDQLRVLGLFSLPEGGQSLNLRRERHALVRLINRIVANGKAAEVRVLQYGVTRERLQEVLEEAEGWDVIHISGHGAPGELLLETAAGKPDKVTATELADMLEPARERVKLVTVAACWSAAMTAAQQRRLLGLPILKSHSPERTSGDSSSPGNFATELTERLGCAVLAMRYPVADEFAIELSKKLYALLVAKGQPLARAVGMTVKELTAGNRFPALSAATPVLFGGCAAELTLAAPKRTGPPSYGTGELKMAGFPPQPERFVGRTGVMARSSEALADQSGIPAVILHGMPGGGKTACALELAYTHEHAFDRLVWYKAPDEGMEISGALTDFALALERYLEGFQMVHLVDNADKLAGFLPRFTELMERSRLLIVIDNAESLLTDGGQWRDDRWGQVMGALTAHRGLGRVIVTSRRVPEKTSGSRRVEPVDALSADEALLLSRELPHLRDLIDGNLPGIDLDTARQLALGVLNVAQGHPKLLELADALAADPDQLAALVEAGGEAWRVQGGLPDGFFDTGKASVNPSGYLHVLAAWTGAVSDTLSTGERDLFWFLCCVEDADRERPVLAANWDDLRERLGRDGQPPALDHALGALGARGLINVQTETDDRDEWYAIHPGVAAAGRDYAGQPFHDAAGITVAVFWYAVFRLASGENADGSVDTRSLVRAGLSAMPYLIRLRMWTDAAVLLDSAFIREPTRGNAAAMLPALKEITHHDSRQKVVLGRVTRALDPAGAKIQLRTFLDEAAACEDYEAATVAAAELLDIYRKEGRLAEALAFAEQRADYSRQAGQGPWHQLIAEIRRLQVLNEMGHSSQVLADVQRLREHMDRLPANLGPDETVAPWHVREMLLDTGSDAAQRLGRWQDALDFNAAVTASRRDRNAPAADIARARVNDYARLLRLGRVDEALALLLDCRQVFQDAGDVQALGGTLCALADTEHLRGHGDAAIRLAHDALRYNYLAGDVTAIVISYDNLGNYLVVHARQPARAVSSYLAAALIRAVTGAESTADPVRKTALSLQAFGDAIELPANVADLSRNLDDIPGTDPAGLIARLSPDPETAEQTLRDLIASARKLAQTLPDDASPE